MDSTRSATISETSSAVTAPERDRVLNLVDYLIKIAELRTVIIRNVEKYDNLLWLSEIPRLHGCYTQVWGAEEGREPNHWIEIQNQPQPELPRIPEICTEWVDYTTLRNKSDLPQLKDSIVKSIPNPNWQSDSDQPELIDQTHDLAGQLDVQCAWDEYVDERWSDWRDRHNDWEKINRSYSRLFQIHQQQLRSREDYELVLAFGLMTWRSKTNHHIRRHLIVADVELTFEAKLPKFTLMPSEDGANFRLELDMLDIDDQPAETGLQAKSTLSEIEIQIENRTHIEGILKSVANSINPRSQYKDSLESTSRQWTEQPIVEYAPALILRKRSTRGLTDTLQNVREAVEAGGRIPPNFGDLAEVDQRSERDLDQEPSEQLLSDDRIFFPLLANDQQRRIVGQLSKQKSVLVQGPPGTGKSQTIVNLICHLLATGRRILITAKTPRALQVIEGLMPLSLRPLCVSRLGQGSEEQRSLETSVRGILRKNQEWDDVTAREELDRLEAQYDSKQRELADVSRRQRKLNKSETRSHQLVPGEYEGTRAFIAEKWSKNKSKYEWLRDTPKLGEEPKFNSEQLLDILAEIRHFNPDLRKNLQLEVPESLPSVDDFTALINNEKEAYTKEQLARRNADLELAQDLQTMCNFNIVSTIRDRLVQYEKAYHRVVRNLRASGNKWLRNVLHTLNNDDYADWQNLYDSTTCALVTIDESLEAVRKRKVQIPSTVNIASALELCLNLDRDLKVDKSLGWWIFAPKIARQCRRKFKHIRIDGLRCDNRDRLSILQNALVLRTQFGRISDLWKGIIELQDGDCSSQISKLRLAVSILKDALLLGDLVEDAIESIRKCGVMDEPDWTDQEQIGTYIWSCKLALSRLNLEQTSDELAALEKCCITGSKSHPIVDDLCDAIRNRDIAKYRNAKRKLDRLISERERMGSIDREIAHLRKWMPELAKDLLGTAHCNQWDDRFASFGQSWIWAQVRSWLREFLDGKGAEARAKRLVHTSRRLQHELRHHIAKIASLKAWSYCFSRLEDDHRKSMEAWLQSTRRFGGGTGKHAPRHRRDALYHSQNCKEAVPAWVMPIHRVWDTIKAEAEMFDCVIVDEASQCGLESLPLLYLGRKVLVVGDDKQISPEAVGLDQSNVQHWASEYLGELQFGSTFDVRSSLFDHGRVRFGRRKITLREHFRCMPEIIKFSNELCYSDTPLIPLRQYGPDRLEPIQFQFVEKGYRSGSASNAINVPEAEALVDKIVEICRDRRYDGKSLGVISLQGQQQALEIERQLLDNQFVGPEEIKRRRLICGTAYSFQGDERDVILLSMVAASNERIGTLTKASDERRFNVAASRARDQMILFHSVDADELSSRCLRRRLLEFFQGSENPRVAGMSLDDLERSAFQGKRSEDPPPSPFDSWFEVDVALELMRKGFVIIPQFKVSGHRIDLVVTGRSTQLAVECDGDKWHGADSYDRDMDRQRQLERCGWEFFRVRQSRFYVEREAVVRDLVKTLRDRNIVSASDVKQSEE